jgi:vitamin B12 transporter
VIVADATYFRNDFIDLIVFDFNTFSLQNVGAARSSGLELSLLVYLTETLTVNTVYTLDDTLNLDTGTALLRRPRDKASMTVTKTRPDINSSIALQMLYVGDRLDTDTILDQYVVLHLAMNRRLTDALTATLRLDNITNTEYEEVLGFGTPGFGMYGGLNLFY